MKQEIYKDIIGYEGKYQISNIGNIKSLFGRVNPLKEPKILNPERMVVGKATYRRVLLSNPRKRFLVHRLVAEHFIENVKNKPCVNHIDNCGTNNSIDNLEWCTYSENLTHAQKQGRLYEAQSKGGKANSKIQSENAQISADSMVEKQFGKWKVIKNLGRKKHNRFRLLCKCICGVEQEVDRYSLLNNRSTQCRFCKAKKVKI